MISRRHVLKSSLGIIALNYINIFNAFGSNSNSNRFQIGACDWSIGQHSNIEAMSVAKKNRIRWCSGQFRNGKKQYALERN